MIYIPELIIEQNTSIIRVSTSESSFDVAYIGRSRTSQLGEDQRGVGVWKLDGGGHVNYVLIMQGHNH